VAAYHRDAVCTAVVLTLDINQCEICVYADPPRCKSAVLSLLSPDITAINTQHKMVYIYI
jgi:hypothetical protein